MPMDIRTAFTIRTSVPVLLLLCGGLVLFGCASVHSLKPHPVHSTDLHTGPEWDCGSLGYGGESLLG